MENTFLRPVSIGRVLRLIVEENPNLQPHEVMEIIRRASTKDESGRDQVNESEALRLTRSIPK
jgi:hypothetical protein